MDVQLNQRYAAPTASIQPGATASNPVALGTMRGGVAVFGATYVGGTASFKVAPVSGGTYVDLYDDTNTKVTIPAAVKARGYKLPAALFAGFYGFKVVAATKQTTTAGAAAALTFAGRD